MDAPAPSAAPANYSVDCTWPEYAAKVVDLIDRGLIRLDGGDAIVRRRGGEGSVAFPTVTVERELCRHVTRESGALRCAAVRLVFQG